MATKGAAHRLRIELRRFNEDPTPLFLAAPLESNILEWRFVMKGAPGTPYAGGYYHGKIVFPNDYPWKPPSIQMITPSGRFKTNTRICLSISDYHPETWSPSWTISTILTGIISFFTSEETTVGSLNEPIAAKMDLASRSVAFNSKDKTYAALFGAGHPEEHFVAREAARAALDAAGGKESSSASVSASASTSASTATPVLPVPPSSIGTTSTDPATQPPPESLIGLFRAAVGLEGTAGDHV